MRLVPVILSFWWFVGFIGVGIFAVRQVQWRRLQVGRLLLVAIYFATLLVSPMFAVLVLGFVSGREFDERMMPAFGATVVVAFYLTVWLRSPVNLREKNQSLPLVTDTKLLQQVDEIARQMNVTPPLVRLLPSLSGHQMALAYAGKLQDPELVVTDGILHRIGNDECAAIIAHEIGHVANGSLWILAATLPLSAVVASVVAFWHSFFIGFLFAIAFFIGFFRIISRPIEYDCDRRAARALGYPVMAAALKKIHAVGQAADASLISMLFYSLSTHPSLDARIASLNRDLPADQQLTIVSPQRVRTGQTLSVIGAAIWITLLGLSLWLDRSGISSGWSQIPLWVIIVVPLVLARAVRFDRIHVAKRRRNFIVRWLVSPQNRLFQLFLLPLICLVIVWQFEFTWAKRAEGEINPWQLVAGGLLLMTLLLGTVWLLRRVRWNSAWTKMLVAAQVHDFKKAVAVCKKNIGMVNQSPNWRHNHAVFKALLGDREAALKMVERLCRDDPDFGFGLQFLCSLTLDLNRPERTLEVVESLRLVYPKSAAAPSNQIRALLRLNRVDEARQVSENSLLQFPDDATIVGLAALLAAHSQNALEADRLIESALEKSPGDTFLLISKAQIKLLVGTLQEAQQAVATANESVQHNPLMFLHPEVEQINNDLKRRTDPLDDPTRMSG